MVSMSYAISPDVGGPVVKFGESIRIARDRAHVEEGVRKRILLVEDDPAQGLLYQTELKRAGYEVFVARDGLEAIVMCEAARPALVIMDIGMPRMNGIDAMDKLIERNHHLHVILFTSYPSYGNNYRSTSADAYVVKSSDLSELKQKIREVLELSGQEAC